MDKTTRPMERMKVLISAYACEPDLGSEQGTGWNLVLEIARYHQVWAITRLKNAKTIDPYIQKYETPPIQWIYYDLPDWMPFSERRDKLEFIYYYLWQIAIYFKAKRLHRQVQFDMTHHLTFVTYWMPSLLSLLPVPFVWGPIGGGEGVPGSFLPTFSFRGQWFENMRKSIVRLCEFDPLVRVTARNAGLILVTSPETQRRIEQLTKKRCCLFSQVGISDHEFNRLSHMPFKQDKPFRIISAGILTQFKNYHLALAVFADFNRDHPDSEYWLFGDGPERDSLGTLCRKLGIEKCVTFFGHVPRNIFLDNLKHCDVFLHPSLHESGSFAVVEALSAGRPVICLDLGGPGMHVNEENGFKIYPYSPSFVSEKIQDALQYLFENPEMRKNMYHNAMEGIKAGYLWRLKGLQINRLYQAILDNALDRKH
jgi:glycosyltransferase involved in cell wall biosynthesis